MIYQAYKVVNTNKMLRITKDDAGWFYIYKMPRSRDNIFASIEEIEIILSLKLEQPAYWQKEIK